jgi:septum formation protein
MTISSRRWVLASASPRRSEILTGLGLKFEVAPSSAPEPPRNRGETPSRYAVRAARMKVREVARRYSAGLMIGADTIVVVGNRILGKPADVEEARLMLLSLGGRWHQVITGISLLDLDSGRNRSSSSSSRVHFRRLAAEEIEWYLRTGEYSDKAGAYAIQGRAALFIDRIEGCYFNIVGFPVATFDRMCRSLGVDLFQL